MSSSHNSLDSEPLITRATALLQLHMKEAGLYAVCVEIDGSHLTVTETSEGLARERHVILESPPAMPRECIYYITPGDENGDEFLPFIVFHRCMRLTLSSLLDQAIDVLEVTSCGHKFHTHFNIPKDYLQWCVLPKELELIQKTFLTTAAVPLKAPEV